MMHHQSPALRWAVIIVLSYATAGMVAVSMRTNYLFGFGFGQTPEKAQVFGWANVAADLWKVSGLILVGSLWRGQRKRLAVVLFPIWLLCLLWGMVGAIGVYAQDRTSVVGGREGVAAAHADSERELGDIERRLAGLTSRTIAQVDAAIAAMQAKPVRAGNRVRGSVGKISAQCTREDRATAEACLEVARLKEERAAAQEAERLRERAGELRDLITSLRARGSTLPADPATELLAWLSGGQLRVRDISFGFPLVFALLIELISAFGPAGITAYAEGTRSTGKGSDAPEPAMASSGELRLAAARSSQTEPVMRWMAERTEPTSVSTAISIDKLYADYAAWCEVHAVDDAGQLTFERAFDRVRALPELDGSIRKLGKRYYGLRLVAPLMLDLQRRSV